MKQPYRYRQTGGVLPPKEAYLRAALADRLACGCAERAVALARLPLFEVAFAGHEGMRIAQERQRG